MSMTLEKVIADAEEEISDCQIDLDGISELLEEYPERKEELEREIYYCKKRMDFNRQLAEWLKELAERRKKPEIIRCKDCKEFRRWIDTDIEFCDRTENRVSENDFCSRAKRRTDGQG